MLLTKSLRCKIGKNFKKKNLNKKSNPAWPLTSQRVFQKFIWALLPFITLSLEVFLCAFYMILESWSKRKGGFGWCQAFHIFWTYFTQSLGYGKMLFCFCILNKNSMTFEETIFYFYFGHSSCYDVLIVSLLPSNQP